MIGRILRSIRSNPKHLPESFLAWVSIFRLSSSQIARFLIAVLGVGGSPHSVGQLMVFLGTVLFP